MPKGAQQPLLLELLLNRHAAGAKAKLLMRVTCNKGLTNPKYKGTQQDLTDKKKRLQRYAGFRGNQGKFVARIKIIFCKKTY